MYIPQADLFHGMDTHFVKKVMDLAVKENHETGHVLFHKGDTASHFYVLLKGGVRLNLGETGQVVHAVTHAGEAFGWSSLVERDVYSTSAECTEPTSLLKISGQELKTIAASDPANGLIFYQRLAGTLGKRLVQGYEMVTSASQAEISPSFGAGHLMETYAT